MGVINKVASSAAGILLSGTVGMMGVPIDKANAADARATGGGTQNGAISSRIELTDKFPGLQNLNTPEGILNFLATKLPDSIPAGKIYNQLDKGNIDAQTRAVLDPKLKDDGKLSRGEALELLANAGHAIDKIEPAQALKEQAARMLGKDNIKDPSGLVASGLAKFAVSGAIMVQRLEDVSDQLPAQQPAQTPRPMF